MSKFHIITPEPEGDPRRHTAVGFSPTGHEQPGITGGVIATGYLCGFASLFIFPPALALAGIVIGIVCLVRERLGHGIALLIVSMMCGLFGMSFGAITWKRAVTTWLTTQTQTSTTATHGDSAPDEPLPVNSPSKAQSSEKLEKVFPTCSISCPTCMNGWFLDELCKPVWKKIEWTNGEATWIDMHAISYGQVIIPREKLVHVLTYTGVPNAELNVTAFEQFAFDCRGHYDTLADVEGSPGEYGPPTWMDAPPRSVAGAIAENVCNRHR